MVHAGVSAFSGAALTHGVQIAFYVVVAAAALVSLLAAVFEVRPAEVESTKVGEVATASEFAG